MNQPDFVDFYSVFRLPPTAEDDTIERVYTLLAQHFGPDNPETGDPVRFALLNAAYQTLRDPAARTRYDAIYYERISSPIPLFRRAEFFTPATQEQARRLGLLCFLYNQRRCQLEKPSVPLLELESVTQIPREHLTFALSYLRERDLVSVDQNSSYMITGAGIHYTESHVASETVFAEILAAGELGQLRARRERSAGEAG